MDGSETAIPLLDAFPSGVSGTPTPTLIRAVWDWASISAGGLQPGTTLTCFVALTSWDVSTFASGKKNTSAHMDGVLAAQGLSCPPGGL